MYYYCLFDVYDDACQITYDGDTAFTKKTERKQRSKIKKKITKDY